MFGIGCGVCLNNHEQKLKSMKRRSSPPPIVFILLLFLLLGGGWWCIQSYRNQTTSPPIGSTGNLVDTNNRNISFPLLDSVPYDLNVRIDGSTSMVKFNEKLKKGFEEKYSAEVTTNANGSKNGIQDLIANKIDVAAVSCDLTDDDKKKDYKQ